MNNKSFYCIGVDFKVFFRKLLVFDKMNEFVIIFEFFVVQDNSDPPGGGTPKVGEEGILLSIDAFLLFIHFFLRKICFVIND